MTSVVYFIACGTSIKIGTTTDLSARLKSLRANSPMPMEVLRTVSGTHHLERAIHRLLAEFRLSNEWFRDCAEVRQAMVDVEKIDVGEVSQSTPKRKPKTSSVGFARVCHILWPLKRSENLAASAGITPRHAQRILAGQCTPALSQILHLQRGDDGYAFIHWMMTSDGAPPKYYRLELKKRPLMRICLLRFIERAELLRMPLPQGFEAALID